MKSLKQIIQACVYRRYCNRRLSACNQKNPRPNAFTLLETLVVIAIIGVLAVFSVPFYYSYQIRSQLDAAVPEMVQTLRRAQYRSVAGENDKSFGVHFESGKFVLFRDVPYDSEDSYNEIFTLSNSLEIYNISFNGGGSDVIFNKLEGNTDDYGTVSIRIKNDSTSRTISVSQEGIVSWQ